MHRRDVKHGRLTSVIHEAAASFIATTANSSSFITVSYVHLTTSGLGAKVYVSIFPEEKTKQATDFLRRQEHACREYIKKHSDLRTVPTIRFTLVKDQHS